VTLLTLVELMMPRLDLAAGIGREYMVIHEDLDKAIGLGQITLDKSECEKTGLYISSQLLNFILDSAIVL
jgi:hypothetical protein